MKEPTSHNKSISKKEFNKKIDQIGKKVLKYYKGIFIHVWHLDKIEKGGGKNFMDALGLYVILHRRLITKNTPFLDLSLQRFQNITKLSRRRMKQAKQILLDLKLVKEARAKDAIGRNMKMITWLPFHYNEKKLRKMFKEVGLTLYISKKSYPLNSDSVGKNSHVAKTGNVGSESGKSHIAKTGKSHPPSSARVYKGIIDKPIIKEMGFLQNKTPKAETLQAITRNSPHGYLRPKKNPIQELKQTDPKHPDNIIYLTLSKKLASIIQQETKLNPTSNIYSWANEMRLLCQKDLKVNGATNESIKKRVTTALSYYGEVIGGEYALVIHSAKSFRDKFSRIESQIKPKKKNNKNRKNMNGKIIVGSGIDFTKTTYSKVKL